MRDFTLRRSAARLVAVLLAGIVSTLLVPGGASGKGSIRENVMFALKAARLGDFVASGMRIGGDKGNVPQDLKGIVQSACLWAYPGVGFQHEQS